MAFPLALLAGGLSLAGGLMQNQENQENVREQEAFQEKMSNTSWQRGVKDMAAAGINPMAQFAQPASSPVGNTVPMQNVMTPAVSSASDVARLHNELATGEAQRAGIGAGVTKALADAAVSRAQAKQIEQGISGQGRFNQHVYSTLDSVIDSVKNMFSSDNLSSVSQQPTSATMLQRTVNAANQRKVMMWNARHGPGVRDLGPGPVDNNDR